MRGEGKKGKVWTSTASHRDLHSFFPYLKALRADFLPLLHPGDAGFGVTYCLAYKRCHSSRDPRLIIGGLDEAGHAYQREVRRLKTQLETT